MTQAAQQATGVVGEAEPRLDWRDGIERLRGAYADGSLEDCARSFRLFERWCEQAGRCALPASCETVIAAMEHWFSHCRASTVRYRLHFIRWVHFALDLPDPTRADSVRLAFRRGERLSRAQPRRASSRQATPINAELCERLAAACPDSLIGLRDRALLSLGYDTLCRGGELVRLRVDDLTRLPSGGARIRVRRSKMDQVGKGDDVYLSDKGLGDVQRWLEASDVRDGVILRPVYFGEFIGRKGFEPSNIRTRLILMGRAAGLTPAELEGIGGHSMRVGAAQDLAVQGRSLAQIMRAGRWRSFESVSLYIKHAPVNIWATPGREAAVPAGPPGAAAATPDADAAG